MPKLDIGVLVTLNEDPDAEISRVSRFGLKSCQVCSWNPEIWSDENGKKGSIWIVLITSGTHFDKKVPKVLRGDSSVFATISG